MSIPTAELTELFRSDLDQDFYLRARDAAAVACDIETTGLDWRTESIATIQLSIPEAGSAVVQVSESEAPALLLDLIRDHSVRKIFHHAMFDLRFLSYHWGVEARSVGCTKIAAKLADPTGCVSGHGLASLAKFYLGVELDKTLQVSDWKSETLSAEQIEYAVADVRFLTPLLHAILGELRHRDLEPLALRCFEHIPTRVALELRDYTDVFTY